MQCVNTDVFYAISIVYANTNVFFSIMKLLIITKDSLIDS